ncbi:family 43 glycosylhydrolase [Oceanobacillus bengalensis]|uniref:Alpha-N-arabinofuranosidase n=1 Tax=Oceanobacillus bengalensis TaxID=1435466 RepID=A0A494YZJ9_9BACI|nr:family 43 glycosylhydrolase [Oceanobacillus bengalensis]RKQ15677.1 alpha-N-arabinofuranosidase [Oceanobacillus bengalensis]
MMVKTVDHLQVTTWAGNRPELENKVQIEIEDGITVDVDVAWDETPVEQYDTPGTYQVEGRIKVKEYPNPLVEQRADPYVYRHMDGYYYFTGSYPEYDRIVLRRSKTIEGLKDAAETVIWEKHEEGIMSKHIWAPELHFINGKWYIHFAAGDRDDVWAIRPYVLECSSENPLEGEWVEKGQINTDFKSFSLDATTFENKGKRFLVWAQKVDNDTISNLYIAEMENPWTIKPNQVVLSTPDLPWEQQGFYVNEGAAVIKRNGNVFITYSASATDHRYAMGLLTADENSNLLDPTSWTKSKEPIFATCEETMEYGPGHNSFTIAEDGITDLMVYHARPYKEIVGNSLYDHNRHARVQQLFWDENGNPYVGYPGMTKDLTQQKIIATVTVK